jgi:pimeloyl-ACP methyl ester carboxylesterase
VSENCDYFADVNGIRICYKVYGSDHNYPLICVHGFGSKKETWIAQLSSLSEEFKVIIFDLRSAGKSDRPNLPYNMEVLSNDIVGLMDYLNIDRAHFLGFSLGGMILQNFVLKYPKRVNKLILINTNAGLPDDKGIEMFKKVQLERIELIKQDPEKVLWRDIKLGFDVKFRKQMEADPKKKFHGIWSVEDLIEYIKINPSTPQDIENQAYAVKSHNAYLKLNQIKNKTLLISASNDKLCPLSAMLEIHRRIPNSIIKVIEGAGHEVHRSNAPEVNNIILNFLIN